MSQSHTHTNGTWAPRRTLTLAAARRHSRFIRTLRWVFWAIGGLIVLTLMGFLILDPDEPALPETTSAVVMTNAKFRGVDPSGLPYEVVAEQAVREYATDTEVKLTRPTLNFFRDEQAQSSIVNAARGVYDEAEKVLEVYEDVHLTTDEGYECRTSHARMLVAEKKIEGDNEISCEGPAGSVRGDSFEIIDNYQRVIFKGNVKSYIIPADSRYKQAEDSEGDESPEPEEEPEP